MIYTGQGYLVNQLVYTKFAIVISFLSLYCVTSNHLVTGYIIVMDCKINGSFPLLNILFMPIRSTKSLFHNIFSLTYQKLHRICFVGHSAHWNMSHLVTYFWMAARITDQYKCWQIITSVRYSPVWRRYV